MAGAQMHEDVKKSGFNSSANVHHVALCTEAILLYMVNCICFGNIRKEQ
jgi:hypothetical protein